MTQSPYGDPKVQHLRRVATSYLVEIAEMFNTPVRVTLVVRDPLFPDGSRDLLISDDDTDAVIAAIGQLSTVGVSND